MFESITNIDMGGAFFIGVVAGFAVCILVMREYFRKAQAAGKVPSWR